MAAPDNEEGVVRHDSPSYQADNTYLVVDGVLIEPPPPRGESYAFSVTITSIYSFMVSAPTLSCWCEPIILPISVTFVRLKGG